MNDRSNCAVPVARTSPDRARPGRVNRSLGWLCRTSATWNSGCRAAERRGLSASTRHSNGTSWWAYAAMLDSRTRPTSSVNVGSPPVSVRRTRVLTKKPMRGSRARSVRPATTLPRGMSVPAPSRVRRAARAARSTMNRVASDFRASSTSLPCSSPSSSKATRPPRYDARAGRGRSAGSGNSSGRPDSSRAQ